MPTTPTIRRATPADAHSLAQLSAELFPLGCPANTPPADLDHYIRTELSPQRFLTLLQDDRNHTLLISVANTPVGYAILAQAPSPATIQPPAPLELRKFYLHPAHHGAGLAHTLMHQVLHLASTHPDARIWLTVFSGNPRAIAFYSKHGFQIVGQQHFLVGADLQQDHLMLRASL